MSDFDDIERILRDNRHDASELELDQIKLRAQARSQSSRPKGSAVRSRLLVAACTLGLMAAGTGGVIAGNGNGNANGKSAAKSEYKPGYGPCKNNGVNPSGTHTGPPGQDGKNCETKPGNGPKK